MYHANVLLKNIEILSALQQGIMTAAAIATKAGFRERVIERSLEQMLQQGILSRTGNDFKIEKNYLPKVTAALELTMSWITTNPESFYEIAKDTARIILTESYDKHNIENVILFGSALHSKNPRDIDLVILHSGRKLVEFSPSHYAEEGQTARYDAIVNPENTRLNAFEILLQLGYKTEPTKRVLKLIGERIQDLGCGESLSQETQSHIRKYYGEGKIYSKDEIPVDYDIYGVSAIFDVHVIHVGLLGDRKFAERMARKDIEDGFEKEERMGKKIDSIVSGYVSSRRTAIDSCNDPTFWHRILSTGKLYDKTESDFVIPIEDKYPGCLALFEQK